MRKSGQEITRQALTRDPRGKRKNRKAKKTPQREMRQRWLKMDVKDENF